MFKCFWAVKKFFIMISFSFSSCFFTSNRCSSIFCFSIIRFVVRWSSSWIRLLINFFSYSCFFLIRFNSSSFSFRQMLFQIAILLISSSCCSFNILSFKSSSICFSLKVLTLSFSISFCFSIT